MSETDLVKFVKSLDDEEFEDLCESIKKSIKHWEDIRDGNDVEISNLSCSLCQTYISCVRCPIGIYTDEDGCKNTPFMEWHYHFDNAHPLYEGDHRVICEECQELAQKEVDFLSGIYNLTLNVDRTTKSEEFYISILNPATAIGDDEIFIVVKDKNGYMIDRGHLIKVMRDGTLHRQEYFNKEKVKVIKIDHGDKIKTEVF